MKIFWIFVVFFLLIGVFVYYLFRRACAPGSPRQPTAAAQDDDGAVSSIVTDLLDASADCAVNMLSGSD